MLATRQPGCWDHSLAIKDFFFHFKTVVLFPPPFHKARINNKLFCLEIQMILLVMGVFFFFFYRTVFYHFVQM